MLAVTALTAALLFDVPVSRASFGDAPWCEVRTGDDASWNCQYRTSQDCLQALVGDHGFCDENPSATAVAQPEPRKRRSQQH